jgi:hypothetical protein
MSPKKMDKQPTRKLAESKAESSEIITPKNDKPIIEDQQYDENVTMPPLKILLGRPKRRGLNEISNLNKNIHPQKNIEKKSSSTRKLECTAVLISTLKYLVTR